MNGRRFKFHPDMALAWADYGQWSRTRERAIDGTREYRHGCRWTDAESRHLLGGYLSEGRDIPSLASRHRRGINGITSQLSRLMGSPAQHTLMLQLWSIEMAEHKDPAAAWPVTEDERRAAGGFVSPEELTALRGLLDKVAQDQEAPARTRSSVLGEVAAEVFKREFQTSTGRPYADVIHAWADGKPVQYRPAPPKGKLGPWIDFRGHAHTPAIGTPAYGTERWEWRVKPAPTVVRACVRNQTGAQPYFLKGSIPNLELTFDDDGQLIGARVYEPAQRAV